MKFPGRKPGRIVQCESALERGAILIQEVDHEVDNYCEQPAVIYYRCPGERETYHVPDLLVVRGNKQVFIEVKQDTHANKSEIQVRTEFMKQYLPSHGYQYELLTESQINAGSLVKNARTITFYGYKDIEVKARRGIIEYFQAYGDQKWGDLTTLFGSRYFTLPNVCRLILEGILAVDLTKPLLPETRVSLRASKGGVQ